MARVTLRAEEARSRLQALGLTQSSLAALCEVDLRTVQRWFAGKGVRYEDAERVASALNRGTADLFDGVSESEWSSNLPRVRAMHRAFVARDGAVAQALRAIQNNYSYLLDHTKLVAHPPRGFVQTLRVPRWQMNGFIALRVTKATPAHTLSVLIRVASSVLVERARVRVLAERAWLLENFFVRSMWTVRRSDESFDLWHWVSADSDELLIVGDADFDVSLVTMDDAARALFDMHAPHAQHAVCIRPSVSQLSAAGLPQGYDRIANRKDARVDQPVPDDF